MLSTEAWHVHPSPRDATNLQTYASVWHTVDDDDDDDDCCWFMLLSFSDIYSHFPYTLFSCCIFSSLISKKCTRLIFFSFLFVRLFHYHFVLSNTHAHTFHLRNSATMGATLVRLLNFCKLFLFFSCALCYSICVLGLVAINLFFPFFILPFAMRPYSARGLQNFSYNCKLSVACYFDVVPVLLPSWRAFYSSLLLNEKFPSLKLHSKSEKQIQKLSLPGSPVLPEVASNNALLPRTLHIARRRRSALQLAKPSPVESVRTSAPYLTT